MERRWVSSRERQGRSQNIMEALMRKGRVRQRQVRFKQNLRTSKLQFGVGEEQLPATNTNIEPSDTPPKFLGGSIPKKKRKGKVRAATIPDSHE